MKKQILLFLGIFSLMSFLFRFLEQETIANAFSFLAILTFVYLLFEAVRLFFSKKKDFFHFVKRKGILFNFLSLFSLSLLFVSFYLFFSSSLKYRWDLNQNKLYTLSDFTANVLAEIKEPITIELYAFNNDAKEIERFALLYEEATPMIAFERKDLAKSFFEANKNDITVSGTLVVQQGERKIKILPQQIIKKDISKQNNLIRGEAIYYEKVINTSLITLESEDKKVYFLSSLPNENLKEFIFLQDSLKILGFQITWVNDLERVNLAKTDLLIIYNFIDLTKPSYEKILSWIDQGGKMMLLLEPQRKVPDFVHLQQLLKDLSLAVSPEEIIVDLENHHFDYQDSLGTSKKGSPLFPKYSLPPLKKQGELDEQSVDYHPITSSLFKENWKLIFKTLLPLQFGENPNFHYQPLIQSRLTSWGEKNLLQELKEQNLSYTSGVDSKAPLDFALAGENTTNGFKIVIVGDIDFVRNDNIYDGVNETFILNSFLWLEGKNNLISKGLKQNNDRFIYFSDFNRLLFVFLFIFLIPLAILVFFVFLKIRRIKFSR